MTLENTKQHRWEELMAGKTLGDLSREEWDELEKLSLHYDAPLFTASLEMTAGALDASSVYGTDSDLPEGLETKLNEALAPLVAAGSSAASNDTPTKAKAKTVGFHLWLAWGTAASMAAMVIFLLSSKPVTPRGLSPRDALAAFEESSPDIHEKMFQGAENSRFASVTGRAVWSTEKQEGYLELTSLPPNDPARAQYQLWIADPKRDRKPIDGGVFDIDGSGSPIVIPINAKLPVSDPRAYVITLEKPGGVVMSDQETVVALAIY